MGTMGSIQPDTSIVRGSVIKNVGRRFARVMQRTLPSRAYQVTMDAALATWRFSQREVYRHHEVAARLAGDMQGAQRAHLVRTAMRRSLVGASGLEATFDAVRSLQQRRIPGCLVELGVARGGCAALIRAAADLSGPRRHLWLFDSYEGLPDPTEADIENGATGDHIRPLPKGSCLGTYSDVDSYLFSEMRFSRDDVTMVKGWFEVTVPATHAVLGPIALLRIDADWYESVRTCLQGLYDQVSPGGAIIVDDYGTCFGARRAVDEFFVERGLAPPLEHDGRGGCLWRKEVDASPFAYA